MENKCKYKGIKEIDKIINNTLKKLSESLESLKENEIFIGSGFSV